MGSEALLDSSECDGCATDVDARHRQTVPQTAPEIVTVWVTIAPQRCRVRIDARRV